MYGGGFAAAAFLLWVGGLGAAGTARFTPPEAVRGLLLAMAAGVPAALKTGDVATFAPAWQAWATAHDAEIRGRLERGDADTIVNWLLFGTTFTRHPRVNLNRPTSGSSTNADLQQLGDLIAQRTRDFVRALAAPGQDERRQFARSFLEARGHHFETAPQLAEVERYLGGEVGRVIAESSRYAGEHAADRQLADRTEDFARRSRLFRDRGLSLDTSMLPGFAIEQTLRDLRAKGAIAAGSVRRAAVIGPGLDFSDKGSGYDFYPQQTLQPFALVDSLRRLGLADAGGVQITTLDISPRVNDHLKRARTRSGRGATYTIRVPLDVGLRWTRDVVDYWKRFGSEIGASAAAAGPAGTHIELRVVEVRPAVVAAIAPEDLDIVVQRLPDTRFDLIVATNVFVYYDVLDQCLALANVEAMLRPGGLLLSNNAVLELPTSRVRSGGYQTVQYSDRPDDGDHIVWYQRLP